MITAQSRIEQAVLRQINRFGGVLITLLPRNVSVWATIDRLNKPVSQVESEIVVQGTVGITAYIEKRLLNDPPEENEIVVESNGATHQVGEVKDLGFRWALSCISEPG